jgi:hypothetical protein
VAVLMVDGVDFAGACCVGGVESSV